MLIKLFNVFCEIFSESGNFDEFTSIMQIGAYYMVIQAAKITSTKNCLKILYS